MSKGIQSHGERASSDSVAQSASVPLPAAAAVQPCAHTAALADAAVLDLAAAVERLGELIGADNEDSNTLNGLRVLLSRAGAMVDMVAMAHGGVGWNHGALQWLFNEKQWQAMLALGPVASAAKNARAGANRADGSAA